MEALLEHPGEVGADVSRLVELHDGTTVDITTLSPAELLKLQCEQEPLFAKAIVLAPRRSEQRTKITAVAYATICAILDELRVRDSRSEDFSMGMDPRYVDLVLSLLNRRGDTSTPGAVFEVGYSSGLLLEQLAGRGHSVGGLEVVHDLYTQAIARLPEEFHGNLLVGDLCSLDLSEHVARYDVVYWNDVFEHIPVDEIKDYLTILFSLLKPGGELVTITPNWLMRPSDVTVHFMPPRSTAVGFHLKEYLAGEVVALLKEAGFAKVRVPALITRSRIHDIPTLRLTSLKLGLERLVDHLPYRCAVQFCRRLGMNCTIATKPGL